MTGSPDSAGSPDPTDSAHPPDSTGATDGTALDTDDNPTSEIPAHGSTHVIRYAARSDRGLIRSTNQDSVFAGQRLLVVADGMGGHAAGDTASRLVVEAFTPLNDEPPQPDLISGLVAATARGNQAIADTVTADPDLEGMGTTVTAMLFDGTRAALAHVGDSRAYLFRAGVLHQLTHDDSFVQSLVDEGRITEDQAHQHPQRNLLLRALTGSEIEPSAAVREVRRGDRFLLCSDGLHGVVDAERIGEALALPDPDAAADTLVQLALVAGAPDNVTVIVADVLATTGDDGSGADGGQEATAARDDAATGPLPRLTQELPRVPLPPIPEEAAGSATLLAREDELPADDGADELEDGLDDDLAADAEDDELDDDELDNDELEDDAEPAADDSDATGAPASNAGAPGSDPTKGRAARARPRRKKRRRHTWQQRTALVLAIVVLVGVALTGATLWVRSQYFVGVQANVVGIFRGVNGSLFGLQFSTFEETSCGTDETCVPIKISDLEPAARHQVSAGIQADGLADAREVMARLADKLLPPCPGGDINSPDTNSPDASAVPGSTCRTVG